METERTFYKKVLVAALFPLTLIALMWLVKFVEVSMQTSFSDYGNWPREIKGIPGIFLMPFLHANNDGFEHITGNSVSLLILGTMVFFFYKEVAFKVFVWVYLIGGAWLWMGAAAGVAHIGASGIIYGLATFLFFSGVIRRYFPLMAVSMLVIFLYGSIIWYIFPIKEGISWQGHLYGGIAGAICAWYFRKEGTQRPPYTWELEELEEDQYTEFEDLPNQEVQKPEEPPTPGQSTTAGPNQVKITYIYRLKPKDNNGES